jgi:hypothetical protein
VSDWAGCGSPLSFVNVTPLRQPCARLGRLRPPAFGGTRERRACEIRLRSERKAGQPARRRGRRLPPPPGTRGGSASASLLGSTARPRNGSPRSRGSGEERPQLLGSDIGASPAGFVTATAAPTWFRTAGRPPAQGQGMVATVGVGRRGPPVGLVAIGAPTAPERLAADQAGRQGVSP